MPPCPRTLIPAAHLESEAENNPAELSQREAAATTWKEIAVIGINFLGCSAAVAARRRSGRGRDGLNQQRG